MVKNYPIDPFNDLLNRFIHEILTDLSVANLLELARHVQSAGKSRIATQLHLSKRVGAHCLL
jgi:hypothetical protein